MNKIELNISELLSKAWEPTKKYGIIIALFVMVITMISQVFSFLGAPMQYSIDPESAQTPEDLMRILTMASGASFMSIIGNLVTVIVTAGLINMVLGLTAGRTNEVKISAFNMPLMNYVNYVAVTFIVGILTFIGTLLCFIPGIFIAVRLSMAQYHVIEHPEDGIIGAIKKSWELTQGNFWNLLLIGILSVVSCFVGLLACCVGMYFAIAFFYFVSAMVYFTLYNNGGTSPISGTPEEAPVVETSVNLPDNYQPKENPEKNEGDYNRSY